MKSSLEFNVRLQEFIELVKTGDRLEAVKHAKKHLASASDDAGQLETVQQACGLLAFPLQTALQPYKELLNPNRWQQLVYQFRAENYRLHQLSSQSMFTVAIKFHNFQWFTFQSGGAPVWACMSEDTPLLQTTPVPPVRLAWNYAGAEAKSWSGEKS